MRELTARVVARSRLSRIARNGVVFHLLSAAATEIAEVYYQIARLRLLFSIDSATGSDLDERAAEIVPTRIARRAAIAAQGGAQTFTRLGTVGSLVIPAGQIVTATDANGTIRYRTTAAVTITPGNTVSPAVSLVALEPGVRANVAAGQIVGLQGAPAGVVSTTNGAALTNGRDKERDEDFRARIKSYVQSLSRGTPLAIETFARSVVLANGQRAIFAKLVEPVIPDGTSDLLIDDGTGAVESFSDAYIGSPDVLVASASGGETDVYTTARPIRDDGSFVLRINGVPATRGADYELNPVKGQVELASPLVSSDAVEAEYRYFTGLVAAVARVIEGDPSNRLAFPGVRHAGHLCRVGVPTVAFQTVDASIAVAADFDVTLVSNNVRTAIQSYINGLDIGEPVIVAEIIERAMAVPGMINFRLTDLSGTAPPADQNLAASQVARVVSADITLI